MNWRNKCTRNTLMMKSSMIRNLVEMTKSVPGLISFAGGFPSPSTFPVAQLADLYREVLHEDGKNILQYGSTGGEQELKQAIIDQEELDITTDEVMICSGATNGIYTAIRSFIESGDFIISESPSFLGSLVAFEAVGANILPVTMRSDGLDIEQLKTYIKQNKSEKIKFIYTIPDFQNPTGITMSNEKREMMIKIAIENDILILEDDPYSKLRFYGTAKNSLFRIAREKFNNKSVVISIRSFSKLLGPGLRIAYTLADKNIISLMNSWAQKINVTTDRVTQRVVSRYLEKGLLTDQIKHIKETYKPLCDQMVSSLDKYMPENVKWTKPEGGMFLWLNLPESVNTDNQFKKALNHKVAFIPGSKFYSQGSEKYNGLRLNFSFPTAEQIDEGIKRIADTLS